MHPSDRETWDSSYREEYEGLAHCNTYKIISQEEYKRLKHKVKGILPTMAIATIKKDGEGNPVRAKYRIIALGNMDPHPWSKQDCFAPVLSQMELRLLISIAVKLKHYLNLEMCPRPLYKEPYPLMKCTSADHQLGVQLHLKIVIGNS